MFSPKCARYAGEHDTKAGVGSGLSSEDR